MAAVKEEEYDLAFLDADDIDQDETDAVSTRLIQLEKDSEIPTRYLVRKIFSPHLEPPYHFHPASEVSQRRKKTSEHFNKVWTRLERTLKKNSVIKHSYSIILKKFEYSKPQIIQKWKNLKLKSGSVHSKWGSEVSKTCHSYSRQDDLVALLTFESSSVSSLDEAAIRKITETLSRKSDNAKLEPLRFNSLQLLMKFSSPAGYEALGKCFLEGKIEEISHLKLTEIQAVSVTVPPPCYIEIATPSGEGAGLKDTLSSLLVSHRSTFPFMCVREPEHKFTNGASPTNSPASKTRRMDNGSLTSPALGVMLMFTQRAKKNSESCLNIAKGNTRDWEQVDVLQAISEDDEVYFKAANNDGPLFAIKKLSPCSGVRILLFVNKNMDEVERFYTLITGKTPLAYNKIEEGLSSRKFPLSEKLELQLVSHPSLKSHPVKNTALCFMMNDVNKMCSEIPGGVRNIGEGHWQVRDPEGNAVILYSLLK